MPSSESRVPNPVSRRLDGILLLDKPPGLSSNQALQVARRIFQADKGGHTGSLDPLATGLLPICFGEATKLAGLLLGEAKSYSARAILGATTDTDDADGAVLRTRPIPLLTDAMIDAALAPLRGRIRQRPPIYSALKRDGEPLYAKARRGETIEVAEREVEVQRIVCVQRGADWLQLEIDCGSGTYVRSLVRDLGKTLGCGAHISELRRNWVEPFRTPRMWTLTQLQALITMNRASADESSPRPDFSDLDACLLPIEDGLVGLPALRLDSAQALLLAQGKPQYIDSAGTNYSGKLGTLAVFDQTGRALGLAKLAADGTLRAQRLFTWAAAIATEIARPGIESH